MRLDTRAQQAAPYQLIKEIDMSMSRKDYVAIAAIFKERAASEDDTTRFAIRELAIALAYDFGSKNPLFDEVRFMKACGF